MRLRLVLIIAAACLVASAANAQLVVGSDQSGPKTIWHVDLNSMAATALYTGDAEAACWGMAYDHDTNTLYWNNGGILYSSPFSLGGLSPTNLGQLTYNGGNVNYVGLGYLNGKLLGTRNITTEAVYEIDPNTLDGTLLWAYPTTFDFGGIDVDLTTTLLYGLSDAGTRGLYEIDYNATTTTFRAPYPGAETDIDGLACYNGLAYYCIDQPGLFYVYDIATGNQLSTLTSPFTGSATFSAAAYVPDNPVSVEEASWGSIKANFR